MNRFVFDMNTFWFYAVILHIAGSIAFSVAEILPFGSIVCLTAMWGIYIILSDKKQKERIFGFLGWGVSVFLLFFMPVSYQSSFFMNLLMLLLVYYACKQRDLCVRKYFAFKKISFRQWGILLIFSITFMIIASYVNALSMLFVNNMTSASLQDSSKYLPQTIFVFAVLPAVTEEVMFRGYIFRGILHKKTAILLSAGMFALLHMNFNQMSYAFIMGIFFAILVSITDNLSMTVMVHLLFNGYNILLAAFPQHAITVWLQTIDIAGYRVFAPSFYNKAGDFNGKIVFIGTIVVLAVLLVTAVLLQFMRRQGKPIETENMEQRLPWNPNKMFWIACFICVLVAVSYEYMI